MKRIKLLSFVGALALMLGFTSCLNDDKDDVTVYQQLSSYFNVYQHVSGRQTLADGVSYMVTYNFTKATADINMTGIKLPDGAAYPTLSFQGLTFTQKDAWKKINVMDPALSGSNFPVAFGNLIFDVADRYVENYYSPATNISYSISEYTVHSFPKAYLTSGTPKVTGPSGVFEPVEGQAPYSFTFDPAKKLCTISIQGMQFDNRMPAQNMRFKDIPFTVSGNTIAIESADPFNPYIVSESGSNIVETPFTRGTISNFKAIYGSTTGATMSFDFEMDGKKYTAVVNSLYDNTDTDK